MGGSAVTLESVGSDAGTVEWLEGLLRKLKGLFPTLHVQGLSPAEITSLTDCSGGGTLYDTIKRLCDAGLDSISNDDVGSLADDAQNAGKWKSTDWLAVHRTAHKLAMRTTASIMFGHGETFEHRVNQLESVRRLQEETGGFAAFVVRSFSVRGFEEATAVEYLKTLAISRMMLDNILNVESDMETQGLKVLQVGLRFGGNDVGSVSLPANATNAATEEQLRRVIRDAGFKPIERDMLYRTVLLN
jgi:cyclic dehypoxanthinyl futalosine synthase